MGKGKKGKNKHLSAIFISVIVALSVTGAFLIGITAIDSIRSNVRSTTIKVIREITNSKGQMLSAILEEAELDIRSLAAFLDASGDPGAAASLLVRFEQEHALGRLTIVDVQENTLYGSSDASLLNGIPDGFARQVALEGFAISDTLTGVDGDGRLLFGVRLAGGEALYASISTDAIQEACGETTYLGEGYSYILGSGGKIVIPPVRYNYEQVYENIRYLLSVAGNPSDKIDEFIEALDSGAAGSVVFRVDGREQLFCFEPVFDKRDWQLVTVVALGAVEKDGARIIRSAMVMAGVIIGVIAAALAAGSFFYWLMQRRQQENDRFLLNIYQAISENTDTVIFIQNDRRGAPDYVFENSGRLLGIPAEEFLSGAVRGESSGAFLDRLQALLQEPWPKEGCRRELHMYNDRLHRDMWLKILICPFRVGDDAKCIYAVTDVTQERSDRERISAAVVAAEQANAAKSSFFSSMSHDMRTPMNGIVGMTEIAKRNLGDRERVLDCLEKIEISSRHLLGLINDVLDMSKIESGRLALASEPFELGELLSELEAILRPQCESKGQTLTFTTDVRHPRLMGDPLRLKQIFMNLLSNAVKFTPEGGTVSFTAGEREQKGNSASFRFTVADNGMGIAPEEQSAVFTPFERASGAAVRRTEGTGLGLAITKNLICAMGGRIDLKSEPGHGAEFLVDLDLALQEGEASGAPDPEPLTLDEGSFAGMRFLLAEDNALNQEIAVDLLTAYGARVDAFNDGKQALERFESSQPGCYDAVLMDIRMPVMDGYEAARRIRACGHPQAKSILIVAMTANVYVEDVLAAESAGMDAHIAKPVSFERLYRVLKEKLDSKSSGSDGFTVKS